jgi:phage terminase large subunit
MVMTTTSTSTELAKRRPAESVATTFGADLHFELSAFIARATTTRFPSAKYQRDPVAFFRDVLGVEPWSKQIEILEAVRDSMRVAICSGHKIGKSACAAGLALWFYCSFEDARVVLSSTTSRQVDQILWRELRMMRARSGRCLVCKRDDPEGLLIPKPCPHSAIIDGEHGELARTGLKSADFREVVGFTASQAEAVAGISGRHVMYILDEASGIDDEIFHAIEGNRAGGARLVLLGNGTRNEGEFFHAFETKAHLYKTLRVSSESTPNVIAGRSVIPGLATREWCEEKKLEWGEASALYRVRVLGEHAQFEEGKIFSLHAIGLAEQRWAETSDAGRLFIGIDPAGPSGSGDEIVFVARRGYKMLALRTQRGLDEAGHLAYLLGMLGSTLRLRGETPVVVVDRGGDIGSKVARMLREYTETHPDAFDLITVMPSAQGERMPEVYPTMRDCLCASLEMWMREGGAILEDTKLEKELHALEWKQDVRGRSKLIAKDVLRKLLGRSPDRYDALALACWSPASLNEPPPPPPAPVASERYEAPLIDPYAGSDAWQPKP